MHLKFSGFVVDLERSELLCNGQAIRVEPQVFDLIVFLASNPGRTLTKDEIIRGVWRDRTVSDSAISTRINAARRALGDDGSTQKFIKTIHGRGFRFEAELDSAAAPCTSDRLHNFAAPSTSFIGREREVNLVKALLHRPDARLVSLTGAGGIGKTRLALQVAASVLDAFRDGVWFVDLAPLRDPELVAPTIAMALGIQVAAGRSILESLKEYLRSRKVLMVVDNFEHLLPAAPLISQLLGACPELRVLATSRATLRLVGEHDFRVPPLTLPEIGLNTSCVAEGDLSESVQLFITRARAASPSFALTPDVRPAIAEICLRLEGLPLAIELAAARVRLFAPIDLLHRLTRRLPVLTGGARDLPIRQQTLLNTIVWSHDLLEPHEQKLFRNLSVFVGGFTVDAVEAVDQMSDGRKIVDDLSVLLDKSLIQRLETKGSTRFWMLETLREFAGTKLQEDPEAADIRRRHGLYFLELARTGDSKIRGAQQEEWLARLSDEHDNFRAALTWAFQGGDAASDIEIGSQVVGSLWWFWAVRGHFKEGREWTERASQALEMLTPPTRAGVLRARANFAFLQGDYDHARELSREAGALYRRLGLTAEAVWVDGLEAISTQYQGDVGEARQLLEGALHAARSLDDAWLQAWILRNLGRSAHDLDEETAALHYFEESLPLGRRAGDLRGIALSHHYLGVIALGAETQKASEHLSDSLAIFRRIDDRRGIAWALHYLAAAALELGNIHDAERLELESLSLRKDLGDKRGLAECLEGRACLLCVAGDYLDAIRHFATASVLRNDIAAPGSPSDERRAKRYLQVARAALGEGAADGAWRDGVASTVEGTVYEMMR